MFLSLRRTVKGAHPFKSGSSQRVCYAKRSPSLQGYPLLSFAHLQVFDNFLSQLVILSRLYACVFFKCSFPTWFKEPVFFSRLPCHPKLWSPWEGPRILVLTRYPNRSYFKLGNMYILDIRNSSHQGFGCDKRDKPRTGTKMYIVFKII